MEYLSIGTGKDVNRQADVEFNDQQNLQEKCYRVTYNGKGKTRKTDNYFLSFVDSLFQTTIFKDLNNFRSSNYI